MTGEQLLSFHATVHARPQETGLGNLQMLRGESLPTLAVSSESALDGFPASFEEVEAAYGRELRMFFEPDGSFVWRSSTDEPTWQVDGLVFDRDGRVRYVELKGACPAARLEWLLAALGWPGQAVMFQPAREAVFLGEAEFRRYAALSE